jgi:nucleotidyltransferase/DNA polymerase involved in DNA repair
MDVACLLVPNFLVALARRDIPSLRGRAVIVGGSPEEHAQVTACSEEAAKASVVVGTTLRKALALCPGAVFLPLQESLVAAEAGHLTELLERHSPVVEVIAPGHAHFDVRGLARMAGMEEGAYLRDLHESASAVSGLPVHVSAAATVFAAHAGAMIPDARFAIPGAVASGSVVLVEAEETKPFLAALPIEVLPVQPAMHARLRLFGLERLGQLADLSFSAMQAQFGREGAHAWELARGKDDTVIVPEREELRISDEMELPAPTSLSEPLVVGTRALLQRALNRPEVRGQTLRRLDWRLGLESGEQVTRRFVFREPTSDLVRMMFVVKNKIERLQLGSAAVSLGVTLSGLCSEYGHQVKLWQTGPRRRRELLEAIDQLNAREGEAQVYRIVEVQPWSRIPERQLALVAYGA